MDALGAEDTSDKLRTHRGEMVVCGGDGGGGAQHRGEAIRTWIYLHVSLCDQPSLMIFVQAVVSHPHLSGSSSRQL